MNPQRWEEREADEARRRKRIDDHWRFYEATEKDLKYVNDTITTTKKTTGTETAAATNSTRTQGVFDFARNHTDGS